jgi:hypothetical protein
MNSGVEPPAIVIPNRWRRTQTIVLTVFCDGLAVIAWIAQPTPQWVMHHSLGHAVYRAAFAVYLAMIGLVSAWLFRRAWRAGLYIEDEGLTIRNVLMIRRIGWQEVSHFEDGRVVTNMAEGGTSLWALAVVLRDGRTVRVLATARGETANPEVLATVRQVAEQYGIRAALTGVVV